MINVGQNHWRKAPTRTARKLVVSCFLKVARFGLPGLLLSATFASDVLAQPTPGGTNILNTAFASFTDASSTDTTVSNTTLTRVLAAYALRLNPPGNAAAPAFILTGVPGDTLYCRVTVDNLANVPDSVVMSSVPLVPAGFNPAAIVFFLDANGNNRLDAGEDNPGFLSLAPGGSTPIDVACILPPAPSNGTVNVELHATSAQDPNFAAAASSQSRLMAPANDVTVVRLISVLNPASVFFGPTGNSRALPGGEGSADDEVPVAVGLFDESMAVNADIENASDPDSVEVFLAPTTPLPAGVQIACVDTSGVAFPAGTRPRSFQVGAFAPGQTRPVRVVLSSPGTPLRISLGSTRSFLLGARSGADSTVTNHVRARVAVAALPDTRTMIGLEQTFRQPTASLGDVVTMVITVTNRTDSVTVDDLHVTEAAPAALDFLSGVHVERSGPSLVWRVGALAPGESRSTAMKFTVNSREPKGWARVAGIAYGAVSGQPVQSVDVIAAIRIDNEEIGIDGFVLGDVWIDEDGDGIRDAQERGAPNVSVVMESGEYAVTDSSGQFSIPHVFEGERMLRLDTTTLPDGTELVDSPVNLVRGGRPDERLVHLIAPAHVRVSFPLRAVVVPPIQRAASMMCEEFTSVTTRPRLYSALKLPSSQFDFGEATLVGNAAENLRPLATFLVEHPGWVALVEGHTDNVPIHSARFPSNRELSLARAQSVCDAMAGMGVSADRVLVIGQADTRPVAGNETPEGRSMNRRVEVSLIPPDNQQADPAPRIGTALRELPALPDSVSGAVHWTLTTTSDEPRRCALRLDVPPALRAGVTVASGGTVVTANAGQFVVDGFVRGRAIDCNIQFTAAAADTALLRAITAAVSLTDSTASTPFAQQVLHPLMRGHSTLFDVATWSETVPVAGTPAPVVAAAPRPAAPGPVAIVDPANGFIVADRDQISVTVRHPLGSQVALSAGGDVVGDDHIGRREIDVKHSQETTTWYGVRIAAGWNDVVALATLPQGGQASDTVRVARASKPAEIVPPAVRTLVAADGRSTALVNFTVRDGFGLPVMDGFAVTLVDGVDNADVVDARPGERGVQIMTHEGLISIPVKPRHMSGNATLAVEADGMRAETEVVYMPAGRPLLATGVIDASAGSYQTHGDGSGHGVTNFHDGLDAQAAARLFVQGAAPGGFQVTGRLDTQKRYDDPLLKQPDPERQYPIFGDASQVHYAAPARGGNYVSLDRGQSYLRYGDFTTPVDRGEFLSYHQAVTGLTSSLTNGANAMSAFVTKADFITRTDDVVADGTSGFYYLSKAPIVENSERVIVETRDRYQSEKIIESRVMMRRRDYTINPYDGAILFMEPVPATDRDLNPNHIVVMYETESGTSDALLFGARGDLVAGKRYRAGVTAITNSGDVPGYSLFGADGETRMRGLQLSGEVAHSEDDNVGSGNAFKVGASASKGMSKLDLYLRRVDGDFSNPSFRSADSELASLKAGFQGRLAASQSWSFNADGYTHELDRTFERRETVRGLLDYRRRLIEMSAGLRFASHDKPSQDAQGVLALAGVAVGNPGSYGISTAWEQNVKGEIVDDYPNRLKTTGAIPLSQHFRALLTHEYLTAAGQSSTNQVTAGIEGTTGGTQAFSRYALDRVANDARMGAVSGIRQQFRLGPTTSATAGIETFTSLSGRKDEQYVSLTTGLGARVSGSYFVDGGYEYRWEEHGDKHLVRVSAAQQLGGGFAWLTKEIVGLGQRDTENDQTQFYATLAGSYRSPCAPVQSLAMLKSYYDRYAPAYPDGINWRCVASVDVNIMPSVAHEIRLKYAYKHVEDWSYNVAQTTNTDLVLGQYVWHFLPGWDVDTWGRMVAIRNGGTAQGGAGLEVGRMFFKALRVGAGYSANGFDDPDVTDTDAWSAGFGVRVQMILSDWLLKDFERLK